MKPIEDVLNNDAISMELDSFWNDAPVETETPKTITEKVEVKDNAKTIPEDKVITLTGDNVSGKDKEVEDFWGDTDDNKSKNKTTTTEAKEEVEISNEIDFSKIAEDLTRKGFLPEIDEEYKKLYKEKNNVDFEWDEENIETLLEFQQKSVAQEIIDETVSKHGAAGKQLWEEVFVKGANVFDLLKRYEEISDVSVIDISTEQGQEKIAREYLKLDGLSKDEIDSEIEDLKDSLKLENKAKLYKQRIENKLIKEKEEFVKVEAEKNQRIAETQRQYESNLIQVLNDSLTKKELNGVSVNKKEIQELHQYMTDTVAQVNGSNVTQLFSDLQKMQQNPEKFAFLAYLIKNDLKVDSLEKKVTTKVTNRLFETLHSGKSKSSSSSLSDGRTSAFKGIHELI